LGRDRTGDLTIFSRSLVPTELPSQSNLFSTLYSFISENSREKNIKRLKINRDPDGT
jgi:hypothetical protein